MITSALPYSVPTPPPGFPLVSLHRPGPRRPVLTVRTTDPTELRIPRIAAGVPGALLEALRDARAQGGRGLLLDLRGCTGPEGPAALRAAKAVVARISMTLPPAESAVVLVDARTGAAANRVAQSLQRAGRAVVVGPPNAAGSTTAQILATSETARRLAVRMSLPTRSSNSA